MTSTSIFTATSLQPGKLQLAQVKVDEETNNTVRPCRVAYLHRTVGARKKEDTSRVHETADSRDGGEGLRRQRPRPATASRSPWRRIIAGTTVEEEAPGKRPPRSTLANAAAIYRRRVLSSFLDVFPANHDSKGRQAGRFRFEIYLGPPHNVGKPPTRMI